MRHRAQTHRKARHGRAAPTACALRCAPRCAGWARCGACWEVRCGWAGAHTRVVAGSGRAWLWFCAIGVSVGGVACLWGRQCGREHAHCAARRLGLLLGGVGPGAFGRGAGMRTVRLPCPSLLLHPFFCFPHSPAHPLTQPPTHPTVLLRSRSPIPRRHRGGGGGGGDSAAGSQGEPGRAGAHHRLVGCEAHAAAGACIGGKLHSPSDGSVSSSWWLHALRHAHPMLHPPLSTPTTLQPGW